MYVCMYMHTTCEPGKPLAIQRPLELVEQTFAPTHVGTHAHTRTHTHTHTHTRTHAYTYRHTRMHAYVHARTDMDSAHVHAPATNR